MRYIPSLVQALGATVFLGAVAVLVDPWVSVAAGGAILVWVGYVLEPDDA
jgi:hypothetical protein